MSDWTDVLADILFKSSFMTLATADKEGLPWASPVEFACDEGLRFYWWSVIHARHSQNIRANPRAALSIYDSTQLAGVLGAVHGLYAEGPVEELSPDELAAVQPSLTRWIAWRDLARTTPRTSRPGPDAPDSPWRFYRIAPTQLYALDPVLSAEHWADWRRPVDLTDSFSRAYRSRLER
jgi:uncharacterized protein YhbP (UPF0306 family)